MKGLVLTAILATAAAPAMAQDEARSLKGSIDAANQAFDAAFNRGDAAAVAAFYTPEATILPPGAPAMTGRAQIQAFWQQAVRQLKHLDLQAKSVTPLGPSVAREIGAFTAEMGGQPVTGKYVVIWRRAGQAWQLDTDIWNTN
jgi:uncharacterized protein (TIGR02246 family)